MEYQYKVRNFTAECTTADVRNKVAGEKIRAQLERECQELARDGWELQGQYRFDVKVKPGCFDFIFKLIGQGTDDGDFRIEQLVFRKPV